MQDKAMTDGMSEDEDERMEEEEGYDVLDLGNDGVAMGDIGDAEDEDLFTLDLGDFESTNEMEDDDGDSQAFLDEEDDWKQMEISTKKWMEMDLLAQRSEI